MNTGQWHVEGERFRTKRNALLLSGWILFILTTTASILLAHADFLIGMAAGLVPLMVCWLTSTEYTSKWKYCENKYRTSAPYQSQNLKNTLIRSLEFQPGQVVLEYVGLYSRSIFVTIPAECVHIHPSDCDDDYAKLKSVTNHFTNSTQWVEAQIYLTPAMQQSMLSLLA